MCISVKEEEEIETFLMYLRYPMNGLKNFLDYIKMLQKKPTVEEEAHCRRTQFHKSQELLFYKYSNYLR